MTKYFYDLQWTFNNLIHLLLGDEKRMSVADWYFYIGQQVDNYVEDLYKTGQLDEETDDNFTVDPYLPYIIDGLTSYIEDKRLLHSLSNKTYNQELKRVGDNYAYKKVEETYKLYKELN